MGKSSEDDVKSAADEATQILGPIMKQSEKGFKLAGQILRQPGNGPVIDNLCSAIEDVQQNAAKLKDILKVLKAAT